MGKLVCEMEVEIKSADGLHMRPAMQFVDLASQFERSIMTITMLQDQVTENQDNPAFVQELKGRLDKQIEKFTEQRSLISNMRTGGAI